MDNQQHVWTIYQADGLADESKITKCYWKYERFDETGKISEQTGDFILQNFIPVEEFAEYDFSSLKQLISDNVDVASIEQSV